MDPSRRHLALEPDRAFRGKAYIAQHHLLLKSVIP